MGNPAESPRPAALADGLADAVERLFGLLERVTPDQWASVPAAGVWSIGKDVEHLSDAAVYHQWIVRLTIGERVASRRPPLERERLTTDLSPADAVARLRQRTDESATLIRSLTEEQLQLPTRPPRARAPALAETIERVLIAHYGAHGEDIAAKLEGLAGSTVTGCPASGPSRRAGCCG